MTFAEYFYYLLHRIYKRGPLQFGSDINKLTRAMGPNYEAALDTLFFRREQAFAATARGKALDQLGADRGLPRWQGETDDNYRLRLLAAYSTYSQLGTAAAMVNTLDRLGYTDATITEMRDEDPDRWAEFKVLLKLPKAIWRPPERTKTIRTISMMKPATTKLAYLDLEAPFKDITVGGTWEDLIFPALDLYPAEGLYPSRDVGGDDNSLIWEESVSWTVHWCPLPGEELYPSDTLYPC